MTIEQIYLQNVSSMREWFGGLWVAVVHIILMGRFMSLKRARVAYRLSWMVAAAANLNKMVVAGKVRITDAGQYYLPDCECPTCIQIRYEVNHE
jgi:hypothetical protein